MSCVLIHTAQQRVGSVDLQAGGPGSGRHPYGKSNAALLSKIDKVSKKEAVMLSLLKAPKHLPEAVQLLSYMPAIDYDRLPKVLQSLDPRKLVAEQEHIRTDNLKRIITSGHKDDPIEVVSHKGKFYVIDGNHRANIALIDGTKVSAKVVSTKKESK